MIEFRQKVFSEYDAMRSLYNRLMDKNSPWRYKIKIIDSASLLPVLRGNNIVIERFVISTQFAKKDKYRMYLKIGAKAKMPDAVRLPGSPRENRLFNSWIKIKGGTFLGQKNNSETSDQKEFSKNKGNNGGNNGGGKDIESGIDFGQLSVNYETNIPNGKTLEYDMKSRSLVLEFDSISDAIDALNILPFGLNYNIYLLDV